MTVAGGSAGVPGAMPAGEVTLLFSDIEGSTKLVRLLGEDSYARTLSEHRALLRTCFSAHRGFEVDTAGDGFFVTFSSPEEALAAAAEAQLALQEHRWPNDQPVRVRMGLHIGRPLIVDGSYVGIDVHRAARICNSAHGGQILISESLSRSVARSLPEGVTLEDLGAHHLKDLPLAERLSQANVEGAPRSSPVVRSLRTPTNVPRAATPLIGRDNERRRLGELLRDPTLRLVTIRGPGGTGKTRIACEVATENIQHFTNGAYFIDLSVVSEADQVVPLINRTINVPQSDDLTPYDALRTELEDKRLLLVLDNAEHVLTAGVTIAGLVAACPRLTVLVTSRTRLGLKDEMDYALEPLGLPQELSYSQSNASDAVRLFVERAGAVRSGFALTEDNAEAVAKVCMMVDGLPLAIELAASKVRMFSPEMLLSRLDHRLQMLTGGSRDSPERQRALRATIDWSYDLLGAEERKFFLALGVFPGGARLESVQAVLGMSDDVSESIMSLVDHSLVKVNEDADGEPRVTLLQTIRDYACDRLQQDPQVDVALRERHAEHYLGLVERTMPRGFDIETKDVQREYENVLASLNFWLRRRAEDESAGTKALRMAAAMGHYWFLHGQCVDGAEYLARALATDAQVPTETQSYALLELGYLRGQLQDVKLARELFSKAIALSRRVEDRVGEAHCLNGLGLLALNEGRYSEAEAHLRAAVKIGEEARDVSGLMAFRNNLGVLYLAEGDWRQAKQLFVANLAHPTLASDAPKAVTVVNLGITHVLGRQPALAAQFLQEALGMYSQLQDMNGVLETVEAAVGLAVLRSRWLVAVRLAAGASAARERFGRYGAPIDHLYLEPWVTTATAHLGDGADKAARHEGQVMTYTQLVEYAGRQLASMEGSAASGPQAASASTTTGVEDFWSG